MITTTKVNVGGKDSNLVVYVPDGTTQKLPAVVFVPGIGEQTGDVNGLYVHGPLAFIKNGWKPDFVVAGIQPPQSWPPLIWLDAMLRAIIGNPANFVDDRSICLTGLSAGASLISYYIDSWSLDASFIKPSSIIIFSYARWDEPKEMPWRDVPAWGLCGDQDANMYGGNYQFWKQMQDKRWPAKPFTTMKGYGHNGWNDFYNPSYVDPALKVNLYDWMKKFLPIPVVPQPQPSPNPQPSPLVTRKPKTIITVYDNGDTEVKPAP